MVTVIVNVTAKNWRCSGIPATPALYTVKQLSLSAYGSMATHLALKQGISTRISPPFSAAMLLINEVLPLMLIDVPK